MRLVLVALAALAIASADAAASPNLNRLDCRRFVFAPACRGATIKRNQLLPRSIDDTPSFQNFDDEMTRQELFDLNESVIGSRYGPIHSPRKM